MRDSPLTPERWAVIDALFDEALDQSPGQRAEWLARATETDPDARRVVERLLAAHDATSGPLHITGELPAASWAAPLMADVTAFADVDATAGRSTRNVPLPDRIGPWKPLRFAGEGGMGTVFEAERADGAFDMTVALKLVRHGLHRDDDFRRRFEHERKILARLQHPGIARLLDGGVTDDGLPWYAMEFVNGTPVDRYCESRQLSRNDRIALMARVCDAVSEAHIARVIHRDLKPGNILVTEDGTPKLLDFGIAKLVAEEATTHNPTMTRTGHRLLTPGYASPEQIRGEEVTPASDVWALGVILYELLTGVHPFVRAGQTQFELERAILAAHPVPPSRIVGRETRGNVDAIVLTALHADPSTRYGSASQLADDLRLHLAGQAVRARRESVPDRARRFFGRHRVAATATVVGAVIGVAGLILADRSRLPFSRQRDRSSSAALAQRFHSLGLSALGAGRNGEATRRFEEALAEDSTFAIAAFYGAEAATRDENYAVARRMLDLAERMAGQAPPRDRLLIRTYLAERQRAPQMHVLADSLVTLYPDFLRAQLMAARAAFWRGQFHDAMQRYRAIARMPSNASTGACEPCEARLQLLNVLIWTDSLEVALREADILVKQDSNSADAWRYAALAQMYSGSSDDRAYRRAVELDPDAVDWSAEWLATRLIREARFAEADQILRAHMATVPDDRRDRSHWLLITSLRNQERFSEALELATAFRNRASSVDGVPQDAVHEALILFERGDARAAAALYDSMSTASRTFEGAPVGSTSTRIWHLVHAADAFAAAGDTVALRGIEDTIRRLAPGSGSARDWRLPDHVRGLRLAARGNHAAAVEAFRASIISPNHGYTRTNLALSRSLLALGRPAEAVVTLRAALRGSLDVNNLYVTHTALHEGMAEAWTAAGNADSARVHAEWVRRARSQRIND